MVGTLFLTLGLAAVVAATFRAERRDRVLLWFGLTTALYGLRMIVGSEAVQAVSPFAAPTAVAVEDTITYLILIPGSLLAAAVLTAPGHPALRYLWRANVALALVEIIWDRLAGRSGAAMALN